VHRNKPSTILYLCSDIDGSLSHEFTVSCIERMKTMISDDGAFDPSGDVDSQKRTLLKIAEGSNGESLLSQAVREIILFLKRYMTDRKAALAHESATCKLPLAEDYSLLSQQQTVKPSGPVPIALKFMAHKDQFDRELGMRRGLDERFVIGVIRSHSSESDPKGFGLAIKSFHNGAYAQYPYCIVLPRATRGLQEVITHDHIAGVPDRIHDVKGIVYQVVEALQHFHEKGIIHAVSLSKAVPLDPLSPPLLPRFAVQRYSLLYYLLLSLLL
jgi:serine/threonine protein kinase